MAENALGRNQVFAIKNADGTPFHDLVLHKATYDSVVMSLGDKITGDVYYKDNGLNVTMLEYIEFVRDPDDSSEEPVKYILVTPPTIVRNGIVSDNSELKGMTKYSFTFYHPMYQLSNLPFSDVAVTEDSKRYLSENKVFSWIGYPNDFITKIDKNLQGTQWMCVRSEVFPTEKDTMLSEVLSFSNNTIADALKAWYDTWDIPYVIEQVKSGESGYNNGKRFKVIMGLPSGEIYEYQDGHETLNKFVFRMGQGLGLKNNSLTPRNNKIVTRISGCGSEDNIPYGYPQIIWYGEQGREFTYGDSVGTYTNVTIGGHTYPKIVSYPIYKGIVGGVYVELIQHPFTRTNLMPSVYRTTLFNKISFLNPNGTPNTNYNPDITLVDSYDAIPTSQYPYVNAINPDAPSYEYHEFEEVKPELGEESITGVTPINNDLTPASSWDDTMNDDGEYVQSYFKITLPILSFDIYACAAITQEMQINMRSGACLGCTFPVQVDWEAYKASFYDEEGEFSPSGLQRDYEKFPDSSQESISLILQKEFATFGTLMPNVYQNPHAGDLFVVLGISLPESYITNAEERLVSEMKSYMLLNNVHYYDYPLKFDEYFLANNTDILKQIRPNSIVRFKFNNETLQLYVKQLAIKFEEATLPQYDITLTDNIDVVTNPIGKVSDSVDKLATIIALTKQGLKYGGDGKGGDGLSRTHDDTAAGVITFLKGINIGRDFISGILGEGGVFRKEADGKTYLETDSLYVRMKAYFDTVEIKKYEHSSGNRTASNAGFKTVRVVPYGYYQGEFYPLGEDHKYHWTTTEIDPETGKEVIVEHESGVLDIQFYRCYYRATDGEDTVTNDFHVGDLAFVRETNTDAPNQHSLWRVVIGKDNGSNITEDGEGWIDLSNRSSEQFTITTIEDGQPVSHNFRVKGYEYGSDAPMAQDDIVQLGNVNNAERQGAIVEYVNGANSPSYQIYQKIGEVNYLDGQTIHNPYVLADKNMIAIGYNSATGKAYMNVYGDAFIGAKDNSTYVKYDSAQKKVTIKAALDINSTVDGKTIGSYFESLDDVHRVFSSELGNLDANSYPKPPYSKGDIWVNAIYPSSDMTVGGQVIPRGSIYNNEILVCKTNNDEKTRTVVIDGEETLDYELFSIADWKLASEYQHTFDYLTNALKAIQGSTQITGGLVLSSMIALRDTQQIPNIWSGISGMYDNTLTTGGIAAWYGGNAIDYEALPTPKPDWSQQRYARSLFRFDGSGYVANGNLSWDNTGRLTIRQVYWGNEDLTNFFNAFSVGTEVVSGENRVVITPKGNIALMNVKENGLVIGGTLTYDAQGNVTGVNAGTNDEKYAATRGWVSQNYISIAYFNRIFQAYKSSTITDANKVIPNDVQTTINNLKIMVGAWTEQYMSALGKNDSGGEIVLNEPLASINDAGLAAHPSSSGQTIVWNGTAWVYGTAGGGTGTVTGVKVGDITYSPVNGIVSIPAYPTSLAWSAITSKPTTIAGYGITDAKIENGVITLGSNSITPLTLSDITDMATKTWVGQQGYLTSSAISDMATKTWVGQQGFALSSSLDNYLPLSAGSSKPLTGSLYLSSRSKGIFEPYTVGGSSVNIPLIYDNASNIWIGATETTSTHHIGRTYISAGHDGTAGNSTIYICVPNAANTSGTNYGVLHGGNYTDWVYSKSQIDTQLINLVANGTANRIAYYTAQRAIGQTNNILLMPNTTNSVNAYQNGLRIWGTCYGNSSSTLLSGTEGLMTYGDGGPQIIFSYGSTDSSQSGALLFTDNDSCGEGASFHFLSNQSDWNVNSKRFVARSSVTIGQNTPNTNYALYTSGNAYFTSRIYLASGVYLEYNGNGGVHLVGAGFYSDSYVSALGLSDSSGSVSSLSDLTDVSISGLNNGQGLVYDSSSSKWKNATLFTALSYSSNTLSMTISGITKTVTIQAGSSGVTSVATGTGLTGGTITSTGTISIDSTYRNYISHGESAYNSLSNYLPLSGGSGNPLTGSLYLSSLGKGVFAPYTVSGSTVNIPLIYDNGENLWIGATQTTGTHHVGATYISAGTGEVYISRLVSGTRTNYKVLDKGNTYVSSGKGYIDSTEITTISGNAGTASKLQGSGAYTAWGQTYWQNGVPAGTITGNMTDVGDISFSTSGKNIGGLLYFNTSNSQVRAAANATVSTLTHGSSTITPKLYVSGELGASGGLWASFAELYYSTPYIDFHYGNSTADYTSRIIENASGVLTINSSIYAKHSGNVSIGTSSISDTYKLNVNGYTKTTRLYLTDSVYLMYDSANSGVKLVGAGFYTDSYVSALGLNSGSGGGGTTIQTLSWSYGSVTSASGSSYDGTSQKSFKIPKYTSDLINDTLASSSDLNNYILKSGGTMTGLLSIATGTGLQDATGNGLLCYHPTSYSGVTSSQWGAGAVDCQGVIRSNASNLLHYRGSTSYNILDGYNSGISGSTITINGTSINSVAHIEVGSNDLTGYSGSFFFGGENALQSGYDYVGFQAGNSDDKWQMVAIDTLKWRQNDSGGTSTNWGLWYNITDNLYIQKKLSSAGWYRVADVSTFGGSIILSTSQDYSNFAPNPATFIISHGYSNTSVSYNDSIVQLGGSGFSGGAVTNIRMMRYNNGKVYIEIYYAKNSANTVGVELTPIGRKLHGYIAPIDFTAVTSTSGLTLADSCPVMAGGVSGVGYTGSGGQQNPDFFGRNKVGFLMSNQTVNGDSTYKNWMYMDCYHWTDAGGATAIGVSRENGKMFIMQSDVNRTSWSTLREVIVTDSGSGQTTMPGSVIPSTTGTYNLGSTTKTWRNIYLSDSANYYSMIYMGAEGLTLSASSSSIPVYVQNSLGVGGTDTNYKLYVNGTSNLNGNVYVKGTLTHSSDMRMKDFIEYTDIDVEAIARAPLFLFTWKDKSIDTLTHLGTSAQYWQGVAAQTVTADGAGTLGLDYGVAALGSVTCVARRVMTHEERIAALEAENERLRNEVEQLKAA